MISSFLLVKVVNAQNEQFIFSNYNKSNGLSNNNVISFYGDSKGFIWIGTIEGLCRFDGYTFKVYKNVPDDSTSLRDNNIRSIFEDNQGKLWIQTSNYFDVFDPDKEIFYHSKSIFNNEISIPFASSSYFIYDNENNIVFANDNLGLYKYYTQQDSLAEIKFFKQDDINRISDINFDKKGNLWVGYSNAVIYCLSKEDYRITDSVKLALAGSNRYSIYFDIDNDLWAFDRNNSTGIFYCHLNSKKIKHFHKESGKVKLNNNTITGIVQDDNGLMWITTDHGGINLINKKDFSVRYILNDPANPRSICKNSLRTIYKDKQGFIWIGAYRNGFSYYHSNLFTFKHYKFEDNKSKLANINDLGGIAEDKDGNLWIGTNGGGLFYIDRKNNKIKHYKYNPDDPDCISSNVIIGLYVDKKNRVWVGTYFGGLNLFDGNDGFYHFNNIPEDPSSIADNRVWDICGDQDGYLWLALHLGGLDVFDPETKKVIRHFTGTGENKINTTAVYKVIQGKDNIMWIGTLDGLRLYNRGTKKFGYFTFDEKNRNSISNNYINDLIEDSRGLIWVATTDGLNIYDRNTNKFRTLLISDGLPSEYIASILEDNKNNIWVGTSNGISNIIINDEEGLNNILIKNYGMSDGLQGDEFSEIAAFKTSGGELFFGGPNGLNAFYPEEINIKNMKPVIKFTDFQVFNKSINSKTLLNGRALLSKSIDRTEEITLKYNENVFTIEFTNLNFLHPDHRKFKYKMENFNENWFVTSSKERKITYTNLDPGTYVFKVRSTNNDGSWNDEVEAGLKIIIKRPWWGTLWFKGALILFLVWLILFIYYYRLYNLTSQKKLLEEKVNERTSQLTQLNKLLEERQEEVVTQNAELEDHRNHLEKLVKERTEKLEVAVKKAQESDKLKSAFLANMSHEIRTPMNAIVGFSCLLLEPAISEDEKVKMVQLINSNCDSLLMLIDDILDLSLIEANQLVINKTTFKLNEFLDNLYSFYSISNPNANVEIRLNNSLRNQDLKLHTDKDRLKQILVNLLGNACKFTKEGYVEVGVKYKNEELHFYVEDTGIGINKEDINYLFERFRKVGRNQENPIRGVGLGLAISSSISDILGGKLKADSEVEKGSVFTFSISTKDIISFEELTLEPTGDFVDKNWERRNILLVEDEEANFIYLKKVLDKTKINTEWAKNGMEVLELFDKKNNYDIVLMDIKMPKLNGYDTAKELRKKYPNQIIIAQTAYARPEDKQKLLQSGFNDYIAKPIKPYQLMQLIEKYL